MTTGILFSKLQEMHREPLVFMPWFPVWGECIILIIFSGMLIGGMIVK